MESMKIVSLIITIVFTATIAALAAPPAPSAPALSSEIVVTASATDETLLDTTATATVITRQEIEARASRNVSELLQTVPGLTVIHSGSEGRQTSLFTRGANSNHTLFLWNGIELNNPYFAGFDLGQFSTAGVERVEVVRGPFSALYGSDAMAGVVQVITATRRNETTVDLQAGERGLINGTLAGSFTSGALSGSASLLHHQNEGFLVNDDFDQQSVVGQFRWSGSGGLHAGVRARMTSFGLGLPLGTSADGTALVSTPERRQEGTSRQLALPIGQTIDRLGWELTLSENRADDDFSDPDDPWGFTFSHTAQSARRAHLLTSYSTGRGTLSVGGELERAVVSSESSFGVDLDRDCRRSRSFFIEDRSSFPIGSTSRLELTAGLRHDDFDTFGSELSPRLAAAAIFGANKLRAAYGEAFRAPSVGELYFPFSGNPSLEPERSRSVEAGFERFVSPRTALSATLFHNRFQNLIAWDFSTFAFANIGRATTRGVELAAAAGLGPLTGRAGYTWLDTKDEQTGETLLRRPRHAGSLLLTWSHERLSTTAAIIHTGSRPDVLPFAPFGRVTSSSYTTADLSIQYRLARFVPYLKIENLTDTGYEAIYGYGSPGRRALLGLRFTVQ
jgi:vitamin B12 transporter